MEKLCMISIRDFYMLGYSSYTIDDKDFIKRSNSVFISEEDMSITKYFIPMKKIEENDKVKYVDLLTGKEFYPQAYNEEDTRIMFPEISNWKTVYENTKPFSTKDGSIRFMEGSIRQYDKNIVNKSKLLELRLKKIYLENSILYKAKINEQKNRRNLEAKLDKIKKISR